MSKYDCLKLDNQLCFPLYACSKAVVRAYKPYLDEIDLTYTQYITMMVLWERGEISSKELGNCLYLDSGTLTPVLKSLESKGFITRNRCKTDERNLIVALTKKGESLRESAVSVPASMIQKCSLSNEEAAQLYTLLHKLLARFENEC